MGTMKTNRWLRIGMLTFGRMLLFPGAILAATWFTRRFDSIASATTAAFCFLVIVLLSAYFGKLAVAVVTSLVATLCYDYFYLPPVGTWHVAAVADSISLGAFLLTSVVISHLTASAAEHGREARASQAALTQLQRFAEWLSAAPDNELTPGRVAAEAARRFSLEYCAIHVCRDGRWRHHLGAAPPGLGRAPERLPAAQLDLPRAPMDLADESLLGVQYVPFGSDAPPQTLFAFKGRGLSAEAAGALASLMGVRLNRTRHGQVEPTGHAAPGLEGTRRIC
jgi:two-component system sensor histidine kinase KdpD